MKWKMANYKNRKPKKFKGCCRMCALGDSNGCRNGRRLTKKELEQELTLKEDLESLLFDLDEYGYE